MSQYEIVSLILSTLAVLLSGVSIFFISNIYNKVNIYSKVNEDNKVDGNNNKSAVIKDGNQNSISQN